MNVRSRCVAAALGFLLVALPIASTAEEVGRVPIDREKVDAERRENIRNWGVSEKTAERMSDALELLEEQRFEEARQKVERVPLRRANRYEKALVHRVLAFVAVGEEDYPRAIEEFEQILAQEALPLADESGIRFNVVQLNAAQQKWEQALVALEDWFRYEENPNPLAYYLQAMAYFQLERTTEAIGPARAAVERSAQPREPWLQLLAALYLAKEDYPAATPVLEQLVTRFPKKDYWVRLSLIYAALENYHESLAVQQLAYTQGLLTEDKELRRLVRTYLYQSLPFQAAQILEDGIADGAIERDAEAFELLANSWIAARDYDRSLEPLAEAAVLAEHGEIYVRLGQLHIRREEWKQAQAHLRKGLDKGGLKDEGSALLLVGITLYSDGQPRAARPWFRRALKYDSSRKQATSWLELLDREEAAAAQEAEPADGDMLDQSESL